MKSKKISRIFQLLLLVLAFVIISLTFYIKHKFGDAKFEQLLYSLKYAEGTAKSIIINAFIYCAPIVIIGSFLCFFITLNKPLLTFLNIGFKNKNIKIQIYPIKNFLLFSSILFLVFSIYAMNSIGFFSYLNNLRLKSKLYDNYYVDPKTVNIIFPEKKRNLVYIFVESLESSYNSVIIKDEEISLIPKMTEISEENISFSDTDSVGGGIQVYGTEWTIAATVAQTAGVNLRLDIADVNQYGQYKKFVPGAVSIGEILEKEGYSNYYMIGSNAAFGGRENYFKEHGNYTIFDYKWAIDNNLIKSDYFVNWGYEDKKLFEFAKDVLTEISKKDEPFNFTMLTVDNHAQDGYLDKSCKNIYGYKYASVIKCNDNMVYNFINWIKKQPFYKNTTIVISGDHITMQGDMENYYADSNNRRIYNTFINSAVTTENTKNRQFCSMDMFPTTLATIGAKISGERLGLGTNLFSSKQTLIEELGYDYFNAELRKKSDYYNDNVLKEVYYEMIVKDS